MTLGGIDTHQSSQALISGLQDRKEVSATRARHDAPDRAKEQASSPRPSSTQDQVSLSQEAQTLSGAPSQASKNSTFQQSPFDQ